MNRLSRETQPPDRDAAGEKRILGAGSADVRFLLENWDEVDREWRKSFAEKFGLDEAR